MKQAFVPSIIVIGGEITKKQVPEVSLPSLLIFDFGAPASPVGYVLESTGQNLRCNDLQRPP